MGDRIPRGQLQAALAKLPIETMTDKELACDLGTSPESVRAAARRMGRKLKVRPYQDSIKMIAHRRLALLRRAHDAMSRRDPDGISSEAWDQLLADIAAEVGEGS